MSHQTVAAGWSEFAGDVIDPVAPPVQYTEMRLAFYAGALWAMTEFRPGAPPPSWRRTWAELEAFIRSDVRRLEAERASPARSDQERGLAASCENSREPARLDVSRCLRHDRIELWIDGVPYAIGDELAAGIVRGLTAALADGKKGGAS